MAKNMLKASCDLQTLSDIVTTSASNSRMFKDRMQHVLDNEDN